MENYRLFSNWLNQILEKDIPNGIKAFNFNLYEGSEDTYHIQLIGSGKKESMQIPSKVHLRLELDL
ncbi:hypothetical protein DQG23_04190 [Paenibacillus contaminans]|uniref:Uncharacterized protein n=1 Tax=Paenibacillus contaminans TaxID=450362 RepID=A0A329MU12_9BACL|nr:hypothetical protein DQG23_04190 [Paenibacillus contaminans]